MPSPLPKTMVFLNIGLVELFLDRHRFLKDRNDLDTRRREDLIINVTVIISSPLQEEERRRRSTKA